MRQAQPTGKGPGRYWREKTSLIEFFDQFPNEQTAERWFAEARWPDGVRCPQCEGDDVYEPGGKAPMRFRCRPCRRYFSTRSGTVMRDSTLGYRQWLVAAYLMVTNLEGFTAMKLKNTLKVRHKTAWHMAHRIREAWRESGLPLAGEIVEIDETWIGGRARNMHRKNKPPRKELLRRKSIVVGAKDRETKEVRAEIVTERSRRMLIPFINRSVQSGATLFTDSLSAYRDPWGYWHESVNHKKGEYVRGEVHTNGIESFWAAFKMGFKTYRTMSKKHLHRYVAEFVGRNNVRDEDTMAQLVLLARAMVGKRLRWKDLTAGAD